MLTRPLANSNRGHLALAVSLVLTAQATAQLQRPQTLQRVEAGGTDSDPARANSRALLQRDMRTPTAFESVYRLDRLDAQGRPFTSYMRLDGNVAAIFPRSQYSITEQGVIPEIPAGTIFHIGATPLSQIVAAPLHRAENFVDSALDLRATPTNMPATTAAPTLATSSQHVSDPTPLPVARPVAADPSIFADESYRRYRVKDLLLRSLEVDVRAGVVSVEPPQR